MLLAYIHRIGNEEQPELCLLADKTDQFSVPVAVQSLPVTEAAVCRVGPYESLLSYRDDEGWIYLRPAEPSKIYLTPVQTDQPGMSAKRIRVRLVAPGRYKTQFQQEKDIAGNDWRDFDPNTSVR